MKSICKGLKYAAETGFKLRSDPDTVRAPDVAFITTERLQGVGEIEGYWNGAPDLAVEVLSPHDRVSEVEERVAEWLKAGSRQVWVVSPQLRSVMVYYSLSNIVAVTEQQTLTGADLLPGFSLAVKDIFAR